MKSWSKGLDKADIESRAEQILEDLDLFRLPIDPFAIAKKEKIKLAPGSYDGCFDARLEFHSSKRRFLLFYADETTGRTEGRIHFTIGHELGHFYLCEHRRFLTNGFWHSSHTGFVSDSRLEREADWFAASLLMPERLFRRTVGMFTAGTCTLGQLKSMADRMKVSVTAAAIRYCEMDFEASSVILSRDGQTLFHVPSYSMKRQQYEYVERGMAVPATSKTYKLLSNTPKDTASGEIDAGVWYEDKTGPLYEESTKLGNSGLILTYLTVQEDDVDDEDNE